MNRNKFFTKNKVIWIVVIIVFSLSIRKTIKHKYEICLINSNPIVTIGKIKKYVEIGVSNYYLTYEYKVGDKNYINEVIPNVNFKNCQHDNKCIGKKIYIKYYANDCSISEPIFNKFPE